MRIDTTRGLFPAMRQELSRYRYKPGSSLRLFVRQDSELVDSLWIEATFDVVDVLSPKPFTVNRWYPLCVKPERDTVEATTLTNHHYLPYPFLNHSWNRGEWGVIHQYLAFVVQRIWQDIELHEMKENLLYDGEFVTNPHPEVPGYTAHKGLKEEGALACDIGSVCVIRHVADARSGGSTFNVLKASQGESGWDDMGTYYQSSNHAHFEDEVIGGNRGI